MATHVSYDNQRREIFLGVSPKLDNHKVHPHVYRFIGMGFTMQMMWSYYNSIDSANVSVQIIGHAEGEWDFFFRSLSLLSREAGV